MAISLDITSENDITNTALYVRKKDKSGEYIYFLFLIRVFRVIFVLTTAKYKERENAIRNTWGATAKSSGFQVAFVRHQGSKRRTDVIDFPNVPDEAYPPQKKSLALLRNGSTNFLSCSRSLTTFFFYQIHGPFKDTLGDILLIVSIGL